MLIRFEVENYRSFAEREELSLVASSLKGPTSGLQQIPGIANLATVPVAIIYGANASGKTNLVRAFRFMCNAVILSHRRGDPVGGVPRVVFALDDEKSNCISRFEVEFVVQNVRYIFGFTCNNERFIQEWLYSFPEGRRRKVYERDGKNVEFGSSMLGDKKRLVDFMRENSLFISTATQNDHEQLSKIVSFFYAIQFNTTVAASANTVENTFKEGQIDQRTIKFLELIGAGITGFEQKEKVTPDNVQSFKTKLFTAIRDQMGDEVNIEFDADKRDVEIRLLHRGRKQDSYLSLKDESAGTRRLLIMMSKIFDALDKGSLLIIDEIDTSLHTIVADEIIALFSDRKINKKGAQLIATTHDTNIISSKNLRRDQIWFCEKNPIGASSIFSLADFKLRATDLFEKGYLEGRFGAIPFAGNLNSLFEESES